MTTKIKAGVIGDGVVGTTQIAANAVTSAKLAQNSVLTKHIDDNQIGIDQLNVSDGSSGQVLTTNGSGTLSFSTISGTTINNNANNRIITGSGTANTLEGEATLLFDGTTLGVKAGTPTTNFSPEAQLQIGEAGTGTRSHLQLSTATNGYPAIHFGDGSGAAAYRGWVTYAHPDDALTFGTTATERTRITSGGAFKTKQGTSAYANVSSNYNEICSNADATANLLVRQGSTYYADCINLWYYASTGPNNVHSNFLHAFDQQATRAKILSNGGFANYQSNDSNLCDEREKKNITTASNTWNDVKAWNIKQFHYNEDDDSDSKRYGVIAQDIETTNPELIIDWEKNKERAQELWQEEDKPLPEGVNVGDEKSPAQAQVMRKAVKEQQMYIMAIKALQEAMAEIEDLKSRIETLEG